MAVADFEQRSPRENRNEQRAARGQFFVVEIAGVPARRIAADAAQLRIRRHTHTAEKRTHGDNNARPEFRGHLVFVEWNNTGRFRPVAVLRKESAASVVTIIDREIDRENLDLERVTRFGAFDVKWTGEEWPSGSPLIAGHLIDDFLQGILKKIVDQVTGDK